MTTKIPKFIVLEGVEASGKSTQLQLLALALRARGHRVTVTAEPTTERLGVFAREMLESGEATAHVAALLFAADRAEHCDALIRPALGRGEVVLCDRYLLSSIVYQGEHGLDASWIRSINRHALEPDLTFVLELLDAATADERRRLRGMRDDGTPYYVQLASVIRRQIDDQVLKAGDQLPTLKEFVAAFGVSPMTMTSGLRMRR